MSGLNTIRLMLTLSACLFVTCSYRPQRPAGTLVLRLETRPAALDPSRGEDVVSASILSHVFESLLDVDKDTFELKGALAKSWRASARDVVFYLRDDVFWHDGKPFDAHDVVFSFELAKKSPLYGAYLKDLEYVRVEGAHAVRMVFSRPYFRMLSICGRTVRIVSSKTYAWKRIGTGPFKFKEVKVDRILLERNKNYWSSAPLIEQIDYRVVTDQSVALQMLKKGSFDALGITTLQLKMEQARSSFGNRFEVFRYYPPNYSFIAWNMKSPFFSDARVRRAMTMFLNKKAILKKVLHGDGELVTSSFYFLGRDYNHDIKPYDYNPAVAVKLLDDAGWRDTDGDGIRDKGGVRFSFNYYFPVTLVVSRAVGVFLQGELRRYGVEMKMIPLEGGALMEVIRSRSFDAVSLAMATAIDDDPYLVWHCSQASSGFNLSGFCSSAADSVLERARVTMNAEVRARLYKQLQKMIYYEQPLTFLFTTPKLIAVSKRFKVVPHKLGLDVTEWVIEDETPVLEW